MNPYQLTELANNEILRKRLAKWMAKFCFRDTKLEELHDRISDEDMRALMVDCADHCYAFLTIIFSTRGGGELIAMLEENDQVPQWDEPDMPAQLIEAAKHLPGILRHVNRATTSR
jgi:hypothetical protein